MTGNELTFWDHVTLLGALGIVVGYVIFRVRIALDPDKGGCGGCSCSDNSGSCGSPPTSQQVDLIHKK